MLTQDLVHDTRSLIDAAPNALASGPTRRGALKGVLGAGFAAAAAPIMAQQAIRTSADGLVAGEVSIMVDGFKVPAYRAAPAGKSHLPVVLVVHEIFGVHEHIADVTRRLAKAGYLAIAPELYARQGDPRSYNDIPRLQAELVSKVPDAQVMKDLDGVVAWAGVNGGNTARVGITGFCWGGRMAWLYAAHSKGLKAAVAWYGRLVGASGPNTPRHPTELAGQLHAPVLGLYGGADAGIPVSTVAHMQEMLAKGRQAAQASTFVLYPDAPHAFHADYRASYRPVPAQDAWGKCLAWFRTHGVA